MTSLNNLERRIEKLEAGSGVILADADLLQRCGLPATARIDIGAMMRAVDGKTRGIPALPLR